MTVEALVSDGLRRIPVQEYDICPYRSTSSHFVEHSPDVLWRQGPAIEKSLEFIRAILSLDKIGLFQAVDPFNGHDHSHFAGDL